MGRVVRSSTAAGVASSGLSDSQAAALPTDGTVYSITNLGSGFANVYEAIPNADGTAASSITDTLVTPFGDVNVGVVTPTAVAANGVGNFIGGSAEGGGLQTIGDLPTHHGGAAFARRDRFASCGGAANWITPAPP